jgi:photosystem II stability/assembly factor-like uncharacterized protein
MSSFQRPARYSHISMRAIVVFLVCAVALSTNAVWDRPVGENVHAFAAPSAANASVLGTWHQTSAAGIMGELQVTSLGETITFFANGTVALGNEVDRWSYADSTHLEIGNALATRVYSYSIQGNQLTLLDGSGNAITLQSGATSGAPTARPLLVWHPSPFPAPVNSGSLGGVLHCLTPSKCVLVGLGGVNTVGRISTTSNGGLTWQARPSNLQHGRGEGWLTSVSCPNLNSCVAVGNYNGGSGDIVVNSTNGGATWTLRPSIETSIAELWPRNKFQPEATTINSISCPSVSYCVAVGGAGFILTSISLGTSWNIRTFPTGPALTAVNCPSIQDCVAVGEGGTILTSTTAGLTWVSRSAGVDDQLNSVSCPSVRLCVVVGNSNTILTSVDNGITWSRSIPRNIGNLLSVVCPSVRVCVATGTGGRIETSTDSGTTWAQQGIPGKFQHSIELWAVSCAHTTDCVVIETDSEDFGPAAYVTLLGRAA